jgi:hypothetical protein
VEKIEATKEVLLDGAQMCIAATVAAIAGFLKQRNIPLKDFFPIWVINSKVHSAT